MAENYQVVQSPDIDVHFPDDKNSLRKRPGSLDYWLNGWLNNTDLPLDDDVLIMVDPGI